VDVIGSLERFYYRFHARGDVIERLRASFPPGAPFLTLDLGGGDGRVSRALAASSTGDFVVADIDPEALAHVPRGGRLRPVLVPAAGRLPFRDSVFDRVIAVDVIHEVDDGPSLLAELARVLRPGGELLVVDFDGRSLLPPVLGWIARLSRRRCRFFGTPVALRDALAGLGLEATVEPIDSLRFLARARAPLARPAERLRAAV
jgi:ubiquinone/menaquinone biosynthesis C-methylase UbiE